MKQRRFKGEMKMLTLMIRIDIYDAISRESKQTGKSKGMLVEDIIEKHLAHLLPENKDEYIS